MGAIKTVLKYVGLPMLMIGLVIGLIFMYNLNAHRVAQYKVTQYCLGENCSAYEQFILEGNRICDSLFNNEMVYLNGQCSKDENMKGCLVNNSYLYCSQKYDGGRFIISEINAIKSERDKYSTEKIQLSSDLNTARTELTENRKTLEEFYPAEFYCYGPGTLEYSYEAEEITKHNVTIENYNITQNYYIEQCALCDDGTRVWIDCKKEEGEWRPNSESEYKNCKECREGGCDNGTDIEKEEKSTKPINISIVLGSNYTRIDLSSLPYSERVKVFEQIKDKDCYTTKQVIKSYYIKEDTLNYVMEIR